jgi:hypothetical protein
VLECVLFIIVLGIIVSKSGDDENSGITFFIFSPGVGFWAIWAFLALEFYASVFVIWALHGKSLMELVESLRVAETLRRKAPDAVWRSLGTGVPVSMLFLALTAPSLAITGSVPELEPFSDI